MTALEIAKAKFEEIRLEYIEELKIRICFLESRIETLDYMDDKFGECIRQDFERDKYESELNSLNSELSDI